MRLAIMSLTCPMRTVTAIEIPMPEAQRLNRKKGRQPKGGKIMAKLNSGIKGLDCIPRLPDPWKMPIPKPWNETDDDVLKDFALLGAIGAIGALVKVLKDGWDW